MNILCIGDVVGAAGCEHLRKVLSSLRRDRDVDLVIANGENSAETNGISKFSAGYLLDSGVDVITGGNHSFGRMESLELHDSCEVLLRPANYPRGSAPGRGWCVVDLGRTRAAVFNLMGTSYMEPLQNPFQCLEELLAMPDLPPVKILDFHAEATGEKRAMAFYADGRLSAIFGTHTHVQTADEQISPQGTGYITDVGMTGPLESVLGVKPAPILRRLAERMPSKFEMAHGKSRMDCVLFTVDEKTGRCLAVERLSVQ